MRTVNREMSESDRSLLRVIVGAAIMWLVVLGFVVVRSAFGARVLASQVSPDGLWKVTIEEVNDPIDWQLYSTLIATGVRKKIGVVVAAHHDVFEFVISADSKLVAYRYGSTPTGKSHLYSTPIDKLQGILISPPISDGGRVGQGISLTCGGMFVQYPYAEIQGGPEVTRVTHIAGGTAKCPLIFADGFESGNKGAWQ